MKVGLFFVCGRNFIMLPQKSVPSLLIPSFLETSATLIDVSEKGNRWC